MGLIIHTQLLQKITSPVAFHNEREPEPRPFLAADMAERSWFPLRL